MGEENDEEQGDPCVPGDLLEIHLALEENGVSAESFKEVFSSESGIQS